MAQRQQATSENEQVVQQMAEEAWNQGNLEIIDEYITEDTEVHFPGIDPFTGAQAYKEQIQRYHAVFSDFHVEITGYQPATTLRTCSERKPAPSGAQEVDSVADRCRK